MTAATALVVFCRRPAPGVGKQRLAHSLGTDAALALAAALLDCALEDAAAWPHELVLAPAEAADRLWAQRLLARAAHVEPQPCGNLGARLNGVDARLRARGLERLLYIGTDAPSLSGADLERARRALEEADVVLAPASDGGVTLMGARRPWPPLHGLPWSSPALGGALAELCRAAGAHVAHIPGSYDVDEHADLERARAALTHDVRPARRRLRALIDSLPAGAPAAGGQPWPRRPG